MTSNKKLTTFLIVPLIATWGMLIAFAVHLYEFGREYPPEVVGTDRMRDAMYGIYSLMGVGVLVSVVWVLIWMAYRKNQTTFDSSLTEEEKAVHHSWVDTSLPISLRGNTLYINRGFSISTMDINEIARMHLYIWPFGRHRWSRPMAVTIYKVNGKKQTMLFERENASGAKAVLEKARQANLSITVLDEANI